MDYDLLIINGSINSKVIDEVLEIDETKVNQRLIVVINTYGGSPYVAYRAMTHLQYLYPSPGKIEFVVPDLAMSAGTLMCLGGDNIYMHEGSCLGPLDLQVEHPSDGEMISSLDIRQAAYRILSLTQLTAGEIFETAKDEFKLSKTEAAKLAYSSAVELFVPLVKKIDPYHLQEGYRAAPISSHYAKLLMVRSIPNAATRNKIAKDLTEEYQTHSYAITKDEVKFLGLNVGKLTELDIYNDVISKYDKTKVGVSYQQVTFPTKAKKEKNAA